MQTSSPKNGILGSKKDGVFKYVETTPDYIGYTTAFKKGHHSNFMLPKRTKSQFSMRPASGVPLCSNLVVPKNIERRLYETAVLKIPTERKMSTHVSSASTLRQTPKETSDKSSRV